MNRFIFTTDDVFVKDGRRMRVLTSGVDIQERFIDNPSMLFGHDDKKVCGKWDFIEKDDESISGVPSFDDDEESIVIKNKVIKGSIKHTSVGLEVLNAYMDGDVITIDKSILLEVSLVAIPANKNAKKVELSHRPESMIFLSNGSTLNTNDIISKLTLNMEKSQEIVESTPVEVIKEVETVITPIETEDFKMKSVELSARLSNSDKEISGLKAELETLKLSLIEKDSKITELQKLITTETENKKTLLLSNAVKDGKITIEAVEDFKDLSFDKVASILDKLKPVELSLSSALKSTVKLSNSDIKSYDWYLKNDIEYLTQLSKTNPALLNQLEQDFINKTKK